VSVLVPISAQAGIYGIIKGKVTDENGEAVIGATVLVEGTKRGARTRLGGKYTITKVQAGTYTVKVSAIGYSDIRKEISVAADQQIKLDFKLKEESALLDEIVVVGDQAMVDNTQVGSIRGINSETLTRAPRSNIQGVVALQAGVTAAAGGFNIRGSRITETQFRIDGLDVGDQFTGGLGASQSRFPTVSSFATEQVQVLSGGFSAEYGNATGGIVNSVTKTGRNDRYEGFLRWRTDIPLFFGEAGNGLQLTGQNENNYDVGFGGPIPGFNDLTFFVSAVYHAQQYLNNGIDVTDPLGNSFGQLDNNGLWQQNLTARMKYNITNDIRLELGGTRGISTWENASWIWLYANDLPVFQDGTVGSVPERIAKQRVNNQISNQLYARLNHNVTESSFYEMTVGWTNNRNELGRRSSYDDPEFLTGIEVFEPTDDGIANSNPNLVAGSSIISQNDAIVDLYYSVPSDQATLTKDGLALREAVPVRNPLTGYYEGGQYVQSASANPYGNQEFFVLHGNRVGFNFRDSRYLQFDGSYTNALEVGDYSHYIKAGFEARFFTLSYHNNGNPWSGQAFLDVYAEEWGGNIYTTDPQVRAETSKPFEPFTGALYVQDQMTYKGVIINAGLRLDVFDPSAFYRTTLTPLKTVNDFVDDSSRAVNFAETSIKARLSPRLSITYPITDRSNFQFSYGVFFQQAPFANLYDGVNLFGNPRGNITVGNPNMEPQLTKSYQISYSNQLTDMFSLDVTAYYKDIFNQVGTQFVSAVPTTYFITEIGEYGNSRGLELTFRKLPLDDHFGFQMNYTLASARGTSSSVGENATLIFNTGADEFTGEIVPPLTEYYLSFDRRHSLNTLVNFVWGPDEGPSIGGIKFLENLNVNFTYIFQSGVPYTKRDLRGLQIGEFRGERQPSFMRLDMRLEKEFVLGDIIGDSFKDVNISFFVDCFNLLNRTEATGVFERTGNPDNNGTSLNRRRGDLLDINFYRDGNPDIPTSTAINQYDLYGNRQYSAETDFNNDGVSTLDERFEAYQGFIRDWQAGRRNYQNPRTVFIGFMLRF
jgi:hypothetical protein